MAAAKPSGAGGKQRPYKQQQAECEIHKADGTSFTLYFPWELNNTDYVRRVVMLVEDALRPTYDMVVAGGAPPIRDGNKNIVAAPDSYYLLKHLGQHTAAYARSLGQSELVIKEHASSLKHLRNQLAHATLGDGFSEAEVRTGFHFAASLASASRLLHVQNNVHRLSQQYGEHLKSKAERRSAGAGH